MNITPHLRILPAKYMTFRLNFTVIKNLFYIVTNGQERTKKLKKNVSNFYSNSIKDQKSKKLIKVHLILYLINFYTLCLYNLYG